jgi:O-antigen/teichoic acid export membrane protein
MKRLLRRCWNSPTIMTWASYSTKALSLFVVLPLIVKRFPAADISLWYLFSSITVLMGLADMGFRSTFSRAVSFAMGGARDIGVYNGREAVEEKHTNWNLIERINSSMDRIYFYLSVVVFILLVAPGTWSLAKPFSLVDDKQNAFIAWTIIILSSVYKFYGTKYQNYLEGLNKIALVRRIESLMSLGAILTSITVLAFGGDLLQLVIATQIWVVANTLRNWYLARIVEEGRYKGFKAHPFDKVFFKKLWTPAWRSGISGIMSNGLTHLSGVIYAQVGDAAQVAGYLLALRIIIQIKEISMAPFYSKIPQMSRLRVEGRLNELIRISQRGMFLGNMIFVLGTIAVALLLQPLLRLIGTDVVFVPIQFWLILSLAFFVHRYGAMHMQLYLTTNHIISHIADGVSGAIFIVCGFAIVSYVGIYAIPIGMLAGYFGFYAWFAAYNSVKSIPISFLSFERNATAIPMLVLVGYMLVYFISRI